VVIGKKKIAGYDLEIHKVIKRTDETHWVARIDDWAFTIKVIEIKEGKDESGLEDGSHLKSSHKVEVGIGRSKRH